jgi:hypothetical protein
MLCRNKLKIEGNMERRKIIKTTLGDLIAAVTDEVTAFTHNSTESYIVVSYIVSDILGRHRVRERENFKRAATG